MMKMKMKVKVKQKSGVLPDSGLGHDPAIRSADQDNESRARGTNLPYRSLKCLISHSAAPGSDT